ncbi:unnamed protein product [Brassica napus]|uniref:(rape) hypothetical protein n=1 Tax=Brassica napus TaxID=3708 RepID=A0A816X0I4_BRANA|nr:unnamed protein product [Brassica napus]CAF2288789.1 unnamed protein product [Brassica napus]
MAVGSDTMMAVGSDDDDGRGKRWSSGRGKRWSSDDGCLLVVYFGRDVASLHPEKKAAAQGTRKGIAFDDPQV